MAISSKFMFMVGGVDVSLVVVERDRAISEREPELAIRTFAVLPTGVRLFEKIGGEVLEKVAGSRDLVADPDRVGLEHDGPDGDVQRRERDLRVLRAERRRLLK